MASSSATSRRKAARLSWPMSTLPVNAVTVPDGETCTQAPPTAPGGGHTTTSPSPRMSNHSRSWGGLRSQGRRGRASGFDTAGGGPEPSWPGSRSRSAARRTARAIRG